MKNMMTFDMSIAGGNVTCYATGNDGIDSNGNFYITGGNVTAYGTGSPEEGIDINTESNKKMYITGGMGGGNGGGIGGNMGGGPGRH